MQPQESLDVHQKGQLQAKTAEQQERSPDQFIPFFFFGVDLTHIVGVSQNYITKTTKCQFVSNPGVRKYFNSFCTTTLTQKLDIDINDNIRSLILEDTVGL